MLSSFPRLVMSQTKEADGRCLPVQNADVPHLFVSTVNLLLHKGGHGVASSLVKQADDTHSTLNKTATLKAQISLLAGCVGQRAGHGVWLLPGSVHPVVHQPQEHGGADESHLPWHTHQVPH